MEQRYPSKMKVALVGVTLLSEHHPMHRKVADLIMVRTHDQVVGFIPGRYGTRGNSIDVFLSLHPRFLSL